MVVIFTAHFTSFNYNTLQLQGHDEGEDDEDDDDHDDEDDEDEQISANDGGRGGLGALGSKVEEVASKLYIIHTTDDGWR